MKHIPAQSSTTRKSASCNSRFSRVIKARVPFLEPLLCLPKNRCFQTQKTAVLYIPFRWLSPIGRSVYHASHSGQMMESFGSDVRRYRTVNALSGLTYEMQHAFKKFINGRHSFAGNERDSNISTGFLQLTASPVISVIDSSGTTMQFIKKLRRISSGSSSGCATCTSSKQSWLENLAQWKKRRRRTAEHASCIFPLI